MSDLRRFRERSSGLVFRVEWQARSPNGPIGLEAMLNPNTKREVRGEAIARDFERFEMSSDYAPTCEKCGGEKIRVGGAPGLYCMHCHVPKTPPDLSPLKPGTLAFGAEGEGAIAIALGDSVHRVASYKAANELVKMLRREINLAWPLCSECGGSGEVGDYEPPHHVVNDCKACGATGRKGGVQ